MGGWNGAGMMARWCLGEGGNLRDGMSMAHDSMAHDNNKIVVVCLPLHTTHALQPCDVGVFGPLAQS
jgi:hypothetical protein